MIEGTIKTLIDRGFGFIRAEGVGGDVFFHFSSLVGVRFDDLCAGMAVRVEVSEGPRGPQAERVELPDPQDILPNERFYNPYNFVRFLRPYEPPAAVAKGGTVTPGKSMGGLSLAEQLGALRDRPVDARPVDPLSLAIFGRCPPPPHDRYVGLTGRIVCEVEAVTPLFISDSEGWQGEGHKTYRFYRRNGQPALPASSLRGMVRSVFEVATNSCMIQLSGDQRPGDLTLTRHVNTHEAQLLVPARVVESSETESGLALDVLSGDNDFHPGQPIGSRPQYAAWVPRYLGRMLRDSHNVPGASDYGRRKNLALPSSIHDPDGKPRLLYALLRKMRHPRRGFSFYSVEALADDRTDLPTPADGEIVGEGYLHITYQNIENKHDERLFFRSDRLGPPLATDCTELPPQVVEAYRKLILDYQDRHADEARKREHPAQPDRSDPDRSKHKPALSRHILAPGAERLASGDLVYASIDRHGQVTFVGPVAMPRIAYKRSIRDCLPFADLPPDRANLPGNLAPCDHAARLCPTCRTFGWVAPQPVESAAPADAAYAGRLRFADGALTESRGTLKPTTLAILSAPKPTTTRFYLEPWQDKHERQVLSDGRWGEGAVQGYDGSMNHLRGRKVYRHHPAADPSEYRRAGGRADDQNRTLADTLAPGARFSFSIDFENLASLELGALLWALELDGEGYHRIGYGKPLGFGSARIKVTEFMRLDPSRRYSGVADTGWSDALPDKTALLAAFREELVRVYPHDGAQGFASMPNIADLLALVGDPARPLPIYYPRSGPHPDVEGKNFKWFMHNNKCEHLVLGPACDDAGLPRIG